MKKIFKLFAVCVACAAIASCTKYPDFVTVPYAALDAGTLIFDEPLEGDAPISYKLPVHVYNATSDCAVTYQIVDGSAKQGLDYKVIGGTGTLNFPVGTDVQTIEFQIIGQPGVYTDNVSFTVNLQSATNGVTPSGFKSCKVTIVDKDFRGDWTWLAGEWKALDYDYPAGTPQGETPYTIEISKVDDTTCAITNLWDGGETIKAIVDFENNALHIPAFQLLWNSADYGPVAMARSDGSSLYSGGYIECILSGSGIAIGDPETKSLYYPYATQLGGGFGHTYSYAKRSW